MGYHLHITLGEMRVLLLRLHSSAFRNHGLHSRTSYLHDIRDSGICLLQQAVSLAICNRFTILMG
ncbi:hypothetical protein CW304_08290 [Bacillus sp. UFRGS-B20]|nr:hypothetical protein CW304_08290 [Bacillus sp. UFRGS-B20]